MVRAETNRFQGRGLLTSIRRRWTPDGELAVVAELVLERPPVWQERAEPERRQPIPLRAVGRIAERLCAHADEEVCIGGVLRRRYYRKDGEARWGQVEVWVRELAPADHVTMEEAR